MSDEPLALLRQRPENLHLLRGFGPLAVGVVLFLAMLLLAPSVAPERIVERVASTTSTTTTTTTTTAPAEGGAP